MSKNKDDSDDKKLIVSIGSALVDILTHEGDDFLERTGAVKGGMTLVEKDFIEQTLSDTNSSPSIMPGGSACNTAVGIGKLGGQARFVGKCGGGSMGNLLKSSLEKNNVEPMLFSSSLSTGRVLSIITPDAQRSMFTYLGASSETRPDEISTGCFNRATIVHIEGYLLFNSDLILAALNSAREAGALISLDLASFTVVEESKDILVNIVKDYVDILIANEDEARVFSGFSDDMKAIRALSQGVEIAVLKVGERGSYISSKGKILKIAPKAAGSAVDTTGAGDLWASGFLFGLANGYPLEKCGELGSACGSEVCRVIGAQIPQEGWDRIKKLLNYSGG
ncbi:MAG: adenosine kinase [Thermodesulfobacteriota bacterium]|nr:adenosine kinase [Thermodesulfobacteriota bacterium]